jgi:hypothetical protein
MAWTPFTCPESVPERNQASWEGLSGRRYAASSDQDGRRDLFMGPVVRGEQA